MTWEGGFVTKDEMYAAVPFGNKFMIIHNGQQITVCQTLEKAKEYIAKKHKPSKNKKVKKTALSKVLEDNK
jgi:hypothetical protein